MDQQQSDDTQAWKVFNRDTQAGRLLSRLYGEKPTSKVSYPQQHRRRRRRPTNNSAKEDNWKTTGCVKSWNKTAEEEKEKERKTNIARALSLNVPKVGLHDKRHSSTYNNKGLTLKIDNRPRRKTELACRNTVEETIHKQKLYRPPHAHNFSSDSEKKRLQTLMKDGKGLPQELSINPPKPDKPKDTATRPATLFDQIHQEILSRRKWQRQMEESGAGSATRETIAYEIKERLEQLKKIDSQRALVVVQQLMKSSSS